MRAAGAELSQLPDGTTTMNTKPYVSYGGFRRVVVALVAALIGGGLALAATPPENPASPATTASPPAEKAVNVPPDQLDSLVAPIALYPDPLLAQTLAASTYPLELVQLQQWLKKNAGLKDKALADAVAKEPWDPSVQSMAALPDVVNRLANDIRWTTDLGNAFLSQQKDVMDAVQRMRKKAQDKGTLKSSEEQKVETKPVESGQQVIVIEQTNPQVVYVPSYDPVIVYGAPIYPYPPIYYPYYAPGTAFVAFTFGFAMGAWMGGWGYGCGWGGSNVYINHNNNFVGAGGGVGGVGGVVVASAVLAVLAVLAVSAVWVALVVSEAWAVPEESAVLAGSAVPEGSGASVERAALESLGALAALEASAVPEAVLGGSRAPKAPGAGFLTGSTAPSIEGVLHTQIARPPTGLVAMLGVLLSHRARPARGSRSAVKAGTCRTALQAPAGSVIEGAPAADSAPAPDLLAADRIASAVATYPAADRTPAEAATPSHRRAGSMDRVRVPRADAAHRAPVPGAAAADAAAAAVDADPLRQPRLIGAPT